MKTQEQIFTNLCQQFDMLTADDLATVINWATNGDLYKAAAVTELLMRHGQDRVRYANEIAKQIEAQEAQSNE